MHLAEMLAYRAVPAAGVSIGLTRKCPLSCPHCSTNSSMKSEQSPAELYTRFVDTFSEQSHPRFMAMSGGEALLRPQLVKSLAEKARESGTRSSVLSGMFFANNSNTSKSIQAAIRAVDHFSISMDEFHEREVPRANVFKVMRQLLDDGKPLSIHIAGRDENDPYLDELVGDVRKNFGNRIPMLVNTLSRFGRAKTLMLNLASRRNEAATVHASPCTMAAWPVVGFDGIVAACGNDNLIGCVPSHLRLGDIRTDSWADIQTRCIEGALPRALRTYGPTYLQSKFSKGESTRCTGYCDTCIALSGNEALQRSVVHHMQKPSTWALSNSVMVLQVEMGAVQFAKRYSHPRFAELVLLGAVQ